MRPDAENWPRAILIWVVLCILTAGPLGLAAMSPLLAWREPIYVIAGFAGVLALALMLVQPLMIVGAVPRVRPPWRARMHRAMGFALVVAVLLHVIALWITSPPDVVDALLLVSPTPFSVWGVIAMWALLGAALLAGFRRRLRLRWVTWCLGHIALVTVAVLGTALHALLIEGTMEPVSKAVLCVCAIVALAWSLNLLRKRRFVSRHRAKG